MAKYNFDSLNPFQPYYKLEKCYKNQQVLDILLYQKQENDNSNPSNNNNEILTNEMFIQKIKSIIEKNLNNKNLKVFSQFYKRGSFFNHDFLSLFIAFNPREFPDAQDLVQKIITIINENSQESHNSGLKLTTQCCKIFEKISMNEFENDEKKDNDSDIIARLSKEGQMEIQNSNNQDSEDSFEGQSYQDTEESQQDQQNLQLKQEIERLRLENQGLLKENSSYKEECLKLREIIQENNKEAQMIQQQGNENIQIILDQKKIMDKFQSEYKLISQENNVLIQQIQNKNQENQQLQQQIQHLTQQLQITEAQTKEIEMNLGKSLDEKQHQLNKFVTHFLIGENKGKCYSNDRTKQRTWEVQEGLKEASLKKQLRDILQLQ